MRIIHDLQLQCLKKLGTQELTSANKVTRLTRSKHLLRRYSKSAVDEKVFTIAAPSNAQNDRVYAPKSSRKKDVTAERLLQTRSRLCKCL